MNSIVNEYHKKYSDLLRMDIYTNWLELEKKIIHTLIEELFSYLGIEQYSIKNTYMVYFTYRNLSSMLRLNERDKSITIHFVGDAHSKKKKRYTYADQIKRRLDYLADQNVNIEHVVTRDEEELNSAIGSNIL